VGCKCIIFHQKLFGDEMGKQTKTISTMARGQPTSVAAAMAVALGYAS